MAGMTTELERPPPPYAQIAAYYRTRIQDGTYTEGARLPPVKETACTFSVAVATAAKAMSLLLVEGLVYASPRGYFVASAEVKATTPQTRAARSHACGSTAAATESHYVTAAEIVTAPVYVAELLALDETSDRVVRREWITSEDGEPRILTVTWHSAEIALHVPALLTYEQADVGTMLAKVEEVTGPAVPGRDWMHARTADSREASALNLPLGAPVLAVTSMLWTREGRLVQYSESVHPGRHTLSYPYSIDMISVDA
jgi:GntR family transcriptional regulator